MLPELDFITDIVEERLAKGGLRWLANFTEIYRDYTLGDFRVPIYALGSLTEKGFFLSKVFSLFVTPKYKVHFLLHTTDEISVKSLRNLILSCKRKFGEDDWILIGVVQKKPIEKAVRNAVLNIADERVGIAAYSLASKDEISSNNVLGRSLNKNLKLCEARFEAFDLADYMKSVAIIFMVCTLCLISLFFLRLLTVEPLSLLITLFISVILGYALYKNTYHPSLSLNDQGFKVGRGKTYIEGKWSDFKDVSIHISSTRESHIRLHSKKRTVDLPVSRIGLSRRKLYNAIKLKMTKK
ncbi:hypothetical protein E3J74_01970 [Candidatus Bathyarchaeota archaeon]|nr:MAG: hypothetical protein E3J74_01970 [Candidatus Bathyarchaeota archaeon]